MAKVKHFSFWSFHWICYKNHTHLLLIRKDGVRLFCLLVGIFWLFVIYLLHCRFAFPSGFLFFIFIFFFFSPLCSILIQDTLQMSRKVSSCCDVHFRPLAFFLFVSLYLDHASFIGLVGEFCVLLRDCVAFPFHSIRFEQRMVFSSIRIVVGRWPEQKQFQLLPCGGRPILSGMAKHTKDIWEFI